MPASAPLRQLADLGTGVKLEKLAEITIGGDLEPRGIAFLFDGKTRNQLTNAQRHLPLGRSLWRCKIGKHGAWHYARTMDGAALAALGAQDAVL